MVTAPDYPDDVSDTPNGFFNLFPVVVSFHLDALYRGFSPTSKVSTGAAVSEASAPTPGRPRASASSCVPLPQGDDLLNQAHSEKPGIHPNVEALSWSKLGIETIGPIIDNRGDYTNVSVS
jgi:hypothetical protein